MSAIVHADGVVPEGLLTAFWNYDAALLANDVDLLNSLFSRSRATLRGDGTSLAVGYEAVKRFRAARGSAPTRRVTRVHVRPLADDIALVVAEVESPTGVAGLQSQVWRRDGGTWAVVAAHVSAPPAPLDRATWRAVGAPLVEASSRGALTGETAAVKDLFSIRGFPTGAGVPEYSAGQPPASQHALLVQRLLDAGASITGIAHTDQFAYSIAGTNGRYGTPLNVRHPERIPGGSSSGPAAATARGWTSIGLGTDTAGSIRVPSAYQGIWGLRTTHDPAAMTGVLPLAESFDAVGWMTRDGNTLARVTDALLNGASEAVDEAALVMDPALTSLAAPEIGAAFDVAAARLGADSDALEAPLETWFRAFRTLQGYQAWRNHGPWISANPGKLDPDIATRFESASRISAHDANIAAEVIDGARARIRQWLGGRVLLLPTVADRPPLLAADAATLEAHRAATLRLTSLASIAGLPAVAAPLLGHGDDGMSLCFVGAAGSDKALVRTAIAASQQLERRHSAPTTA